MGKSTQDNEWPNAACLIRDTLIMSYDIDGFND